MFSQLSRFLNVGYENAFIMCDALKTVRQRNGSAQCQTMDDVGTVGSQYPKLHCLDCIYVVTYFVTRHGLWISTNLIYWIL
jgi:hypothetical protein